ncbi:MAG TPA: succinate dehydrogenase cytochrome b subunit [Kofleriaceae bacterium]|nr:succinate dehydrogenase cytochrome b subunit [Kofleriaceae bacterium]
MRSSIGAKQVMAVTGLGMVLFALIHMTGHLQMFGGRDMYNGYAHFLQHLEVKWVARLGLIAIVVIHIFTAISLVMKNRAARPVAYAMYKPVASTPMSRYMAMTGLVILAFIIYHLLHFTIGTVQPQYFHMLDDKGRYDAYSMFVRGFQNVGIFASYAVAVFMLCMHLGHGASSWIQSLGWRHPKYGTDKLGPILGIVLFLGYIAPPTAVLIGMIKLPGA